MKEKILKIMKSKRRYKKYTAIIQDKTSKKIRILHFGDNRYPQYRDSTKLGLYSKTNHNDIKRMRRYYMRHSGTQHRIEAIKKEQQSGLYTPKLLSHIYLW